MIILPAMALTGYNTMFILGLTSGLAGKGGVIVTTLNPGNNLQQRAKGIEPSTKAWEAFVLPLYYARNDINNLLYYQRPHNLSDFLLAIYRYGES